MGEADSIVDNFAVGSRDKFPTQVVVAASDGILRKFVDHVLWRLEQDAAIDAVYLKRKEDGDIAERQFQAQKT